ncbi:phospholipase A [Desulfopila sp. IMCC35008]|uniref:phospholipase A n=1 Tax=Desulfopila sp. IMCC35008 TaxID=2653858 RepID=UPI0013D86FD7|nr:phospholipase A [Desulfopila sp. IMCC35008]
MTAPDTMTLGEARRICSTNPLVDTEDIDATKTNGAEADKKGRINERLAVDDSNIRKPFTLMSHQNNYILVASYNFQGWDVSRYQDFFGLDDIETDDLEVQFQLSIKTPLAVDLFDNRLDIFAGYTVNSYWQFYNDDASSPFRETNHEPEVWLQVRPEKLEILGFSNTVNGIGMNHMSNGQGGSLSRSWNRVYGFFAFERDNMAFMIKPWMRIAEDSEDDDNPDITDYYGHGELWLNYSQQGHTFSFMARNNLESGFSKGAVELGWSFPILDYPYLKGYIQYFSGYGESLIDYNRYVNRIGVGLQLTDIL